MIILWFDQSIIVVLFSDLKSATKLQWLCNIQLRILTKMIGEQNQTFIFNSSEMASTTKTKQVDKVQRKRPHTTKRGNFSSLCFFKWVFIYNTNKQNDTHILKSILSTGSGHCWKSIYCYFKLWKTALILQFNIVNASK